MLINAVRPFNLSPSFKSNIPDSKTTPYDDSSSDFYGSDVREIMRNNIYERAGLIIPEYVPENATSIEDARINNFAHLPNGAYRGASLANRPECIELLAKSGVGTVIDLEGSFIYEKYCKKNNINYYFVNMINNFWTNPIFRTDEELISAQDEILCHLGLSKTEYEQNLLEFKDDIAKNRKEFIDRFIKISDVMNRGNYYVGCELGDYRTDCFLALQYYFNPKWKGPEIKTEPYIFEFCQNMYRNLTSEDKAAMGISPRQENIIRKRLNIK